MSSLASVQLGDFVDLDCDEVDCSRTAKFQGASWRICEAAAEAAGWVIDEGTGSCFCPDCVRSPHPPPYFWAMSARSAV